MSNSVSAPATAMASNTNSDDDTITNCAANNVPTGCVKRKKRNAIDDLPIHGVILNEINPTKASDVNLITATNKFLISWPTTHLRKRRSHQHTSRNFLSTFRRVLRNGFYPDKYNKRTRQRKKRKKLRKRQRRYRFRYPSRLSGGIKRYRNHKKVSMQNRKIDYLDQFSILHDITPRVPFTQKRKHGNSRNGYFSEKNQWIHTFPLTRIAQRRNERFDTSRAGVNSIHVQSGGSDALLPLLLGIFGIFQLLTTGAIGNLN